MAVGSNWQHEIIAALKESDVCVVVISQSVIQSPLCSFLLGHALGGGKHVKVGSNGVGVITQHVHV